MKKEELKDHRMTVEHFEYKLPENLNWHKDVIKWVVGLGTGSIVIFITFYKDLEFLQVSENLYFIAITLFCLSISIAFGILAIIFLVQSAGKFESMYRSEIKMQNGDKSITPESLDEIERVAESNLSRTNKFYEVMIWSFFTGVFVLMIFTGSILFRLGNEGDLRIKSVTPLPKDQPLLIEYNNGIKFIIGTDIVEFDTIRLNPNSSADSVIVSKQKTLP